jgi:cell division septation protein DedD
MPVNANQITTSRRNVIIAIVVLLAMNIFVFFMGVTLGRHGRQFQAPPTTQPPIAQPAPVVGSDLENDLAAFEEKASKERETPVAVDFLDEETLVAENESETPAEPEIDLQPEATIEEQEPVAKPKPDPSVPDANALSEGFWIQVLAIGELNSAEQFKNKLQRNGYAATIIAEADLYKVQVGPFEERQAAAEARQQLNDLFQVDGWIRKR